MRNLSRADGFTIVEMMVSTAVVLMVLAGALTTFRNALAINDTATQLADSNQNLRAGTNQLVKDLMMAGRMIGSQGIAMPTGGGITYARPGPTALNFDLITSGDPTAPTVQLPSISTGFELGPTINGKKTDIITIMTVDEFMPGLMTPPADPNAPSDSEGTIAPNGSFVTLAATSQWIDGDVAHDTPKIKVGDLVLYVGQVGNAIQTVTSIDTATHRIFFTPGSPNDFFHFNQPNATTPAPPASRPLATVKQVTTSIIWPPPNPLVPPPPPLLCATPGVVMNATSNFCAQVTLLKVLMITYYVDNTTTPGTPRLTRVLNHSPASCTSTPDDAACAPFAPQALAGVVEDLHLTYDVYDGAHNPAGLDFLPQTINGTTYTDNQIRKVNIHVGVRSENKSPQTQDYVRNHMSTSVNIRSLAAVDKYPSGQ